MLRLAFAFLFLVVVAAVPIEDEKTFPGWPNSFSTTFGMTAPFDSPEAADGELITKIWYDGEARKMKRTLQGRTLYALSDYKGRTATIGIGRSGECTVYYQEGAAAEDITKNPLPNTYKAQYLGEVDLEGEKVEQWQMGGGETIMAFVKQQSGVAIPVRFQLYPKKPPPGSDMILPFDIEVKEFTTTTPDASVFEFDDSKCTESKPPSRILSTKRLFSM